MSSMTAAFLDAAAAGFKRKHLSSEEGQHKKERKISEETLCSHNNSSSSSNKSAREEGQEEEERINNVSRDGSGDVANHKKGKKARCNDWTKEEIDLLKEKTKQFNGGHITLKEFEKIPESFLWRSGNACHAYYDLHLRNKGTVALSRSYANDWSEEQIDLLKEKTNLFNGRSTQHKDFKEILEFFPNKTAGACQAYYDTHLKKEGAECPENPEEWSSKEIDLLKEKTRHFGGRFASHNDFIELEHFFPGRTASDCNAFFKKKKTQQKTIKRVGLKYQEWNQNEIDLLKEKTKDFSETKAARHKDFKDIADYIKTRSARACMIYFNDNLRNKGVQLVECGAAAPPSSVALPEQVEELREQEQSMAIFSGVTSSGSESEQQEKVEEDSNTTKQTSTTTSSVDFAEEMCV
jgi:hypothetical protein